jgi:hypothetical protein
MTTPLIPTRPDPVLGWSDDPTSTTPACAAVAEQIGQTEIPNERSRYRTVFDFLDQHSSAEASATLVIQDTLLGFSSESNLRAVLSRLLCEGSAHARALVAERTTRRNFAALQRAVRCLGLEYLCDMRLSQGWCLLSIQRGNSVDKSAWLAAASATGQAGTAETVARRIAQALHEKTGFSLLRFGHCESKFVGFGTHFGLSDVTQSAKLQWGAAVSVPRILRLQADISEATYFASVVGIKPRTALEAGTLDILNSAAMAIAIDRGVLRPATLRVDSNIHFDLAASGTFLSLFGQASRLVVVSPRLQLVPKLSARFHLDAPIDHIEVPGEFRVNGEGGSEVDARFGAFQVAEERLLRACVPGALVLIGAGLVGKHWCMLAHQRGAVAVDMGSVLDAWAGIQSRSSGFPERVMRLFNAEPAATCT